MKLKELKEHLFRINLNRGLQLTPQEKITNLEQFVKTHVSILESNPGKARYKPYYDRLLKVYQILSNAPTS